MPTDVLDATADAALVVDDYFGALDAGRFDEAAACFSQDVYYSHPPYRHTGLDGPERRNFRGRDQLAAAFRERGQTSFGHEVTASVQRGPHCIFEGRITDLPGGATITFLSSLTLGADGTIRRYVSFYCDGEVVR